MRAGRGGPASSLSRCMVLMPVALWLAHPRSVGGARLQGGGCTALQARTLWNRDVGYRSCINRSDGQPAEPESQLVEKTQSRVIDQSSCARIIAFCGESRERHLAQQYVTVGAANPSSPDSYTTKSRKADRWIRRRST